VTRLERLSACALVVVAAACGGRAGGPNPGDTTPHGPAPDSFNVRFETSRGPFTVAVIRSWAPLGVDRLHDLVNVGFFSENRFFRVVPGFVVQFGLNDRVKVNDAWDSTRIADDPVKQSNARGTIAFATEGPNTRSHQLFINLGDNARLDGLGFAPIGRVIDGMSVVDSIYSEYGERPDQNLIQSLGNAYLARSFPKLDYITSARVIR
jgi:peptidyl-prolyl cis-trans isomerase A (cyclophilin A)